MKFLLSYIIVNSQLANGISTNNIIWNDQSKPLGSVILKWEKLEWCKQELTRYKIYNSYKNSAKDYYFTTRSSTFRTYRIIVISAQYTGRRQIQEEKKPSKVLIAVLG